MLNNVATTNKVLFVIWQPPTRFALQTTCIFAKSVAQRAMPNANQRPRIMHILNEHPTIPTRLLNALHMDGAAANRMWKASMVMCWVRPPTWRTQRANPRPGFHALNAQVTRLHCSTAIQNNRWTCVRTRCSPRVFLWNPKP